MCIRGLQRGQRARGGRTLPGGDHRFEGLALVFQIGAGHFDQARHEIVTTLQLNVDLREGIAKCIAQADQMVVGQHRRNEGQGTDEKKDQQTGRHEGLQGRLNAHREASLATAEKHAATGRLTVADVRSEAT
jgi:hypothetical protein